MPVKSIAEHYTGDARDRLENFHGNQLVYVGWDKHLMFAAPFTFLVSPELTFGEFFNNVVAPAFDLHPKWRDVNISAIQWLLNGSAFEPILDASLHSLSIDHKSLLRMNTPSVPGYKGQSI